MKASQLLLLLLTLVLIGCIKDKSPIVPGECENFDFEVKHLPYESLRYTSSTLQVADDPNYIQDSSGVLMTEYHDSLYYHPVTIASRCYIYLSAYAKTSDKKYLNLLDKHLDLLVNISFRKDSAMFFPYNFAYDVHQNSNWRFDSPWYSGMAQGKILSIFSRAFELTGQEKYLLIAEQIFNSFFFLKGEKEPWVARYDDHGCYWIEEYPLEQPGLTLNGFMFAMDGLYDYYRITKTEKSKQLLKKSLNTIKNHISLYRRKGKDSYYCLEHRHLHGDSTYHLIHIGQLEYLYMFTDDIFFKNMADSFYLDSH